MERYNMQTYLKHNISFKDTYLPKDIVQIQSSKCLLENREIQAVMEMKEEKSLYIKA